MDVFWSDRNVHSRPCERAANACQAGLRQIGYEQPQYIFSFGILRICVPGFWNEIQMNFNEMENWNRHVK